jgi:hypothetical protein
MRPLRDMRDHRPAGDVGERLAGKPRGGHSGRDQDYDGHLDEGPERAVSKVAKRLMETALIGVATTKQKT